MSVPHPYQLKSATAEDQWSIRRLVLFAGLDPTQIRWSQFWVIVKEEKVIGCGQLRPFADAQELGSLVIARGYRGQGLGSALVQHLIQAACKPLFLECLGQKRVQFYTQLGFQITTLADIPLSLRRKFRLTYGLASVLPMPLVVMKYEGDRPSSITT